MPKYIPRVINTRNHNKKPKKKVTSSPVVDELVEFKKNNVEKLTTYIDKEAVTKIEEEAKKVTKRKKQKKRKVNTDPVVKEKSEVIPEPEVKEEETPVEETK